MGATPARSVTDGELAELATAIHRVHRAHLRELRIEMTAGGLVLTGHAVSYYGKQMAQEEVLQRGLAVVANDVAVGFSVGRSVSESV